MRKGQSIIVLEREVGRLNKLGARVQEEANMRRFFLACVISKVGPVEITAGEIAAMKAQLADGAALKIDAAPDNGIRFSLTLPASLAQPEAPVSWWRRILARARLWAWRMKVKVAT